ncbi:MAG TPA: cytochrome c [Pseudolabrys sp.]|jgi:mono/diheme cytochrome c family protein
MLMVWRLLAAVVVVIIVGFGAFYAWAWNSELPPANLSGASFDPGIIAKGAKLAAIGDCAVCHTRAGGRPYAGGFPLETPFGAIYGTNITPDPQTGIGLWSEAAFRRAMRSGVDREGNHLYPAFPYDHFTKATDSDISALYAFLMTRDPVEQENRPLALNPPLNWRLFAAGWKLLFLTRGAYQPDPKQSPEWNRGAYLVTGLAHCGACHTPRDAFGAETDDHFGGGTGEGWLAPALNASSPAPVPWNADQIYAYLRTGFADQHGFAAGPMQPVVHSLRNVQESDLRAIAAYISAVSGPQSRAEVERRTKAALEFARSRDMTVSPKPSVEPATTGSAATRQASPGAAIFAGACASCHHSGGTLPVSRPISLGLSTPVNEPDPTNLIRIVLGGIHPLAGDRGPIMPGFAGALTDRQIAALVSYVRSQFSGQPAWPDADELVSKLRQSTPPPMEAP